MRFWKSVSAKTAWSPPRTKETVLGRLCRGNGGDRRRPHGDVNNSGGHEFQACTNFDSAATRELARHCRPSHLQLTRTSAESVPVGALHCQSVKAAGSFTEPFSGGSAAPQIQIESANARREACASFLAPLP